MPYTEKLARLQRLLRAKQRALFQLEQEQAHLQFRETLLKATYEALEWVMQRQALLAESGQADLEAPHGSDFNVPLDSRREDQRQQPRRVRFCLPADHCDSATDDKDFSSQAQQHNLLASKSSRPTSSSPAAFFGAASNDTSILENAFNNLIVSTADPLQLLHELSDAAPDMISALAGPHDASIMLNPATIHIDELRSYYRNVNSHLQLHMGHLERMAAERKGNSSCAASADMLTDQEAIQHQESIKQLLYRYLHLLNDIMLHRGFIVILHFFAADVIGGKVIDNELKIYEPVLPDVNLTRQQTDTLVTCFNFLVSLYGPVTVDRCKLLQQQDSPLHHEDETLQPPMVDSYQSKLYRAAAADCASGARPFQRQRSVQQQQQLHWQHQQQRLRYLDSLDINMGKEMTITHIAGCTLWGCLTWSQAAELILGCYPVVANPIVLASVLQQLKQGELKPQRKQRRRSNLM